MTAEAGGIAPVPLKMTGKLIYLMIELGHLREMIYPRAGQAAPMRKKKVRPLSGPGCQRLRQRQELPCNILIDLALRELPCRANDSPNNGGSAEYLSTRANKAILLVRITHIWNICKHPRLDAELNGSRNDRSDNLTPEHRARPDERAMRRH